jgi:4-hydroxy-tetrahydrodipicolinate reductase
MDATVGIAVLGASGRMGRMLVRAVEENPGTRLIGATERPGHALGRCRSRHGDGRPALGVTVVDDPLEVFVHAHAALDFTSPDATMHHAELAAQARLTHVIGTTGLERSHVERLAAAARHAVIVRAGNMSVGVNLLTVLVRRVAEVLGPDYDIEIVEMHHRAKVDAPSGTALMLGEAAAAGRRVNLADVAARGRDGITGRAARERDRLREPARRRRRWRARDRLRRSRRAGGAAPCRDRPHAVRARRGARGALGAGARAGPLRHDRRSRPARSRRRSSGSLIASRLFLRPKSRIRMGGRVAKMKLLLVFWPVRLSILV